MKPFDKTLFDENDRIAKDAVRCFLETKGVRVEDGYQYGVDLHAYRGQDLVAVLEVERRPGWVNEFPFNTVHVPYRKAKFLEKGFVPSYLFSVRADCKQALWCSGEVIVSSPVVEVANKYLPVEKFFDVPFKHWRLARL